MAGKTFQKRLLACQRNGNLTVADLCRWFQRSYQTVRYWVEHDARPYGAALDQEKVEKRLALLEREIGRQHSFPIPSMSQTARIAHINKALREAR